jgi:single-strand DNA-binding protein
MNQVQLIGRVGQYPSFNENKTMLTFSIATTDGFGENKKTNWHNVKAFGKVMEVISKYVAKGDMLAVTGSIDYSESKDGKKYTNIVVRDITLISAKKAQEIEDKPQNTASMADVHDSINSDDDDLPF